MRVWRIGKLVRKGERRKKENEISEGGNRKKSLEAK
jgi:hypothetical protein